MEPGASDTGLGEPGGKTSKTGPMETGGQNKQNCPERAAGAKLGQEVADAAEAFTETAKATEAKRKRKPTVKVATKATEAKVWKGWATTWSAPPRGPDCSIAPRMPPRHGNGQPYAGAV